MPFDFMNCITSLLTASTCTLSLTDRNMPRPRWMSLGAKKPSWSKSIIFMLFHIWLSCFLSGWSATPPMDIGVLSIIGSTRRFCGCRWPGRGGSAAPLTNPGKQVLPTVEAGVIARELYMPSRPGSVTPARGERGLP